MTKLHIALSPCPNDTYAFEEMLLEKKRNDFSYELVPHFYDIETLNQYALEGAYPIIKVSAALYPLIQERYCYLETGAAFATMGGPIVIAKNPNIDLEQETHCLRLAAPGSMTSAFQTFCHMYGTPLEAIHMPYHQIAEMVAHHAEYDIGILIHEARTTFQEDFPGKLTSLADLNEKYKTLTSHPMPLGLIVARRDLSQEIRYSFEIALKASIQAAMKRKKAITRFIEEHASHLSHEAILNHIHLYVNQETLSMSSEGEKALSYFFSWLNAHTEEMSFLRHTRGWICPFEVYSW